MPPEKRPPLKIICEGDTDSAVYEALVARGVLPALDAYPKKEDKKGGLGEQNTRLSAILKLGPERLMVARDLDQFADGPALLKALAQDLGPGAEVISEKPVLLLEARDCRIALLPQGLLLTTTYCCSCTRTSVRNRRCSRMKRTATAHSGRWKRSAS